MNIPLDLTEATEIASWFQCLGDPTRLLVLNVIARADHPLTVGEITEAVGKRQSTVSHHLKLLAAAEFVHVESDANRTLVSVNPACMDALPEAASRVMHTPVRSRT